MMLAAAYIIGFLLSGSSEPALLGLQTQTCPFFPLRYQDLSVIKNVIVPTVVIGPPVVSFFLVVINALFLTIFCGWKGKNTDADEQEETPYRKAFRERLEERHRRIDKWLEEFKASKKRTDEEKEQRKKERRARRAKKGVPYDVHQQMDTYTGPAFQMAPRYVYPYLSLYPHKSTPRDLSRRRGQKHRRPTPITRDIHSTRLKTTNS